MTQRNELTDRTEHTMIVSFIVLDFNSKTIQRQIIPMKIFTILQLIHTIFQVSISGRRAGDIAILSSRCYTLNPGFDIGSDPGEDIIFIICTTGNTDASVSK